MPTKPELPKSNPDLMERLNETYDVLTRAQMYQCAQTIKEAIEYLHWVLANRA